MTAPGRTTFKLGPDGLTPVPPSDEFGLSPWEDLVAVIEEKGYELSLATGLVGDAAPGVRYFSVTLWDGVTKNAIGSRVTINVTANSRWGWTALDTLDAACRKAGVWGVSTDEDPG